MTEISLEIQREITQFNPEIPVEKASTPPSSWYVSQKFCELEFDTVFQRNWLIVGNVDQLQNEGDYLTGEIANQPYLVLRAPDGEIRAFYNVCQHHGACILSGSGTTKQLRCPYHGWSYGLDGVLKKAPQIGPIKDFQRAQFSLKPIQVTTWCSLIFIYLGEEEAPDIDEQWAELSRRIAALASEQSLRYHCRKSYELNCNWKVFIDNYLDGGYHVSTIHPGLASELDVQNYRIESFDQFSIQSCVSNDSDNRLGAGALYAFIYPNLMINRYGSVLDINIALPISADRCLVIFDYFFEEGVSEEFIENCLRDSDQVQQEDINICASVQKGLRSRAYDRGRYAPNLEKGMHRFHQLLAKDYLPAHTIQK